MMNILPSEQAGRLIKGSGALPRFGLNQHEELQMPSMSLFQLPHIHQRRAVMLLSGPQSHVSSFSLQGLPSDGNRLLAFRLETAVHEHDAAGNVHHGETDIYLFIHVEALLALARRISTFPPAPVPWPVWQHCGRFFVPPPLPHAALAWQVALCSSGMREGFYIEHHESMEDQSPLPAELWGNPDYLTTIYALDFHPRRVRYMRQYTEIATEPLLSRPIGSAHGVPIFADPSVSPGTLACNEFMLKYPDEVTDILSEFSISMTEDGAFFFGHKIHGTSSIHDGVCQIVMIIRVR